MRYLFLELEGDIKDEQDENIEILTIAGKWIEEESKKERSFFRIIKPHNVDKIRSETLTLLHIARNILEEAHGIKDVSEKFQQTFPKIDILVVWNRETIRLFEKMVVLTDMKRVWQDVIILQDLILSLDIVAKNTGASFEKMLARYHVRFNPNLFHIAKHDVEYLKDLFYIIKEQLNRMEEIQEKEFVRIYMSNIIHHNSCHYILQKEKTKIISAEIKEVLDGSKLCTCCLQKEKFYCIPKQLFRQNIKGKVSNFFSERKIEKICQQLHMSCRFSEGIIFINTQLARWRIYHDGTGVLNIYHENYRQNRSEAFKRRKKCNEGFHQQQVKIDSYYAALYYIYNHDRNFLKKDNNIMDELFKMIEIQRENIQKKEPVL